MMYPSTPSASPAGSWCRERPIPGRRAINTCRQTATAIPMAVSSHRTAINCPRMFWTCASARAALLVVAGPDDGAAGPREVAVAPHGAVAVAGALAVLADVVA